MPVAFTNSDGIAQVTLPGFHGRFQIVVFDPNHRGRFQLASVLLRGESGFHVDRVPKSVRVKRRERTRSRTKKAKRPQCRVRG